MSDDMKYLLGTMGYVAKLLTSQAVAKPLFAMQILTGVVFILLVANINF